MKNKGLIIAVLMASITFLSVRVYHLENEKRIIKEDLIELSKVKYGLFNVDEWKAILGAVISKKIDEFNFNGANRPEAERKIAVFLHSAINDFESSFRAENSRKTLGFLNNMGASMFGVFDKIRAQIPSITEKILSFLDDPRNRKAIKGFVIQKLNEYTDQTFSDVDYSMRDAIVAKYKLTDRETAIKHLEATLVQLDEKVYPFKVTLFLLALAVGVFILVSRRLSKSEFLYLTVICFILLLSGLMLPMIEIDARISEMSFKLLGEDVIFKDQVLYYKSKSIIEVVTLMIRQSRIDLLFVGLLVFTFSVLFPVAKLVASVIHIYSKRMQGNKFIRFMIFRTGKWSMADVMVIAIFMAYIGFSGIITEQLKQLESITQNLDILTTNRSSLLTGFFTFTAFAILSLLTSHKLQYQESK